MSNVNRLLLEEALALCLTYAPIFRIVHYWDYGSKRRAVAWAGVSFVGFAWFSWFLWRQLP